MPAKPVSTLPLKFTTMVPGVGSANAPALKTAAVLLFSLTVGGICAGTGHACWPWFGAPIGPDIGAGAGIDIGGVGTGALGGLCAFAICTIAPVPSAVTPASSLLRMPSIRPYRLALQMVARDAITAAQT